MVGTSVLPMEDCSNFKVMISINFNHLNEEAQERLLKLAREQIEISDGKAIREYCERNGFDYEELIQEESIRKLYTMEYIFKI